MVPKKTKSKRKTLHEKYKIQRKVLEHHRQLRKLGRKMEKEGKKKHERRDPGIPNNWPFKEELLLEAKQFKEQAEAKRAEERKKRREERSKQAIEANVRHLAQHHQFEEPISVTTKVDTRSEFERLVDASDVLIETLDARDPIACRSLELEKLVLEKGKILLFLLTKPDLIPQSNLKKWLNLLRPQMPLLMFKNILPPTKNFGVLGPNNFADRECVGDLNLLQVLKTLRQNSDNTDLRVGLFGYFNTGKKQFLESMNMLAYIKDTNMEDYHYMQLEDKIFINKNFYVSVDKKVGLPSYAVPKVCHLVNEIKLKSCEALLSMLVKDSNKDTFSYHYNLPRFTTVDELCEYLYDKRGRGKNSVLPKDSLCRQILRDIYVHKIPSYSLPMATLPSDEVLEGCKPTLDLIDRVSLYQKEDEQVQTLMVKKYKYIINDNYISGAWEKSLKEEEKEVVCEQEEEAMDSDEDLLNEDEDVVFEEDDQEEKMEEDHEDDAYNFETDF